MPDLTFDLAGASTFLATLTGVIALAFGRPEQWGLRRIALGVCACSASAAALLLTPSALWWGGVLWGAHQVYVGGSFLSRRRRTSHERAAYLEASVSVLSFVALADGRLTAQERGIIHNAYARAGMSVDELRHVDEIMVQCERAFLADGSDPNRLFSVLRAACETLSQHSNDRIRAAFFQTALRIAASDGYVSAGEDSALKASALWLGLSDALVEEAWASVLGHDSAGGEERGDDEDQAHSETQNRPTAPPDLATYYASVLGVSVSASPSDVKRAYRQKAKEWHPDVVAHKGPKFAQEAEERFKELSRAYQFFGGGSVVV